MHAPDSSPQPIARPVAQESPHAHQSPEGLTPLEFAARVYNRVLIMLVLYILSIGPMYWSWVESVHLQGHPAVARFYYPLRLVCDIFPSFGAIIDWYISLWV